MANRTALFNRSQPGGVVTISDFAAHPGDIWFVDAGSGTDGAGYGEDPDSPCKTLEYVITNKATASQGDVIYCMPGHTEALGADSAVDVDKAGLTIVGLGYGANRPTFTATATAGDFKLAAASGRIENLLFLSGIDATTGMLEISGTDCQVINCEFRDSVDQATDCILTVNGSDRLLIDGCKFNMATAGGANTAIALDGSDDTIIRNCWLYGEFALGAIQCRTTASARIHIHDCTIWTQATEDLAIHDFITGSTGFIGPNLSIMLADNAANITTAVTGATFQMIDPVYIVNLVNEKAMLSNWTASTHGA